MRRTVALVLLAVVAYVGFLVARIPATFVAETARARSAGSVRLTDARGTAWNGEARASIAVGPGGRLELDRVRWHVVPDALAAGRLAFDLEAVAPGLEARGQVARAIGEWQLRDVVASGDAERLARALPILAPWKPQGAMRLSIRHVDFDGEQLRGEGSLEWRDAGLALSPIRPLGTWRLEASAASGPGKLSLSTLGGPLRLGGQGTFAPPRSIAFDGTARAEGPEATALGPLLDLMGPRQPDGSRALTLRAP